MVKIVLIVIENVLVNGYVSNLINVNIIFVSYVQDRNTNIKEIDVQTIMFWKIFMGVLKNVAIVLNSRTKVDNV